jgi:hypothetical protein
MSSAILYIGIVAIWAFVLVPRWLRRDHEQPAESADDEATLDAEPTADVRHDSHPADRDETVRRAPARPAPAGPAWSPTRDSAPQVPTSARSRAMQARRRMLTMLVTLTGGAVACFLLKLTPWWAIIPPAGMLGGFVLLLREATLADAERARRRAGHAARARATARHEPDDDVRGRAVAFEPPEPSAEVIDISARVSDQLYDQYADATIRAVGD